MSLGGAGACYCSSPRSRVIALSAEYVPLIADRFIAADAVFKWPRESKDIAYLDFPPRDASAASAVVLKVRLLREGCLVVQGNLCCTVATSEGLAPALYVRIVVDKEPQPGFAFLPSGLSGKIAPFLSFPRTNRLLAGEHTISLQIGPQTKAQGLESVSFKRSSEGDGFRNPTVWLLPDDCVTGVACSDFLI